jgi:addiction module HigA family antidote
MMNMKDPSHPGDIIQGSLEELGLSVTDAAKALGVSRVTLSRLLHGHTSVSPEMAVRLSKAFGSTPEFWLKLQLQYDLAQIMSVADKIEVAPLAAPVH